MACDTTPRIGDSNYNLLFKIAAELSMRNGGVHHPYCGDSENNLLFKIAQLTILDGGDSGGAAALAACQAQVMALQSQVSTFETFDMGWEWTPSALKLGNMFGYLQAINDLDVLAGITSLTFKGTQLQAGLSLQQKPTLLTVSLPNLLTIGQLAPSISGALTAQTNAALVSFSAPLLTDVQGSFTLSSNVSLVTLNVPSLQRVSVVTGSMTLSGNTGLTTISLPAFISVGNGSFSTSGDTLLTTVSFPNYLPTNGQAQNFGSCALTQASVDHVLARCVANAAYVSGTVTLNGGTNSTPSAAGLADKAILVGRGVTVLNN